LFGLYTVQFLFVWLIHSKVTCKAAASTPLGPARAPRSNGTFNGPSGLSTPAEPKPRSAFKSPSAHALAWAALWSSPCALAPLRRGVPPWLDEAVGGGAHPPAPFFWLGSSALGVRGCGVRGV
jgi:hypothetical protein